MPRTYLPAELRFWAKVQKTDTCWIWTANKNRKGYGRFLLKGRLVVPHRYSYELLKGQIPDGMQIDHLCRNTLCVNPEHLEAVEGIVNIRRGRVLRKPQNTCKRGHPLSGDNLYIGTGNRRVCKECHRMKSGESQQRRIANFYSRGLTWEGKPRKTRRQPPLLPIPASHLQG